MKNARRIAGIIRSPVIAPGGVDAALDGGPDPEQRLRLWGERWMGREREFYRECAAMVAALRWSDVTRVCGQTVAAHARLVRAAYADLVSAELPPTLQLGPVDGEPPRARSRRRATWGRTAPWT